MGGFDRLARVALLGAMAIALGVGGCGRKSALDPPPSASVTSNEPAPAAENSSVPSLFGRPAEPARDTATTPTAPQSGQKKFFLDWLLN